MKVLLPQIEKAASSPALGDFPQITVGQMLGLDDEFVEFELSREGPFPYRTDRD
jgi:hypothetical protein